jgi:hypothetical protein
MDSSPKIGGRVSVEREAMTGSRPLRLFWSLQTHRIPRQQPAVAR